MFLGLTKLMKQKQLKDTKNNYILTKLKPTFLKPKLI